MNLVRLEDVIALSKFYRSSWRSYLQDLSQDSYDMAIEKLLRGLDEESKKICEMTINISSTMFPTAISAQLFVCDDIFFKIFPRQTIEALRRYGFFSEDTKHRLNKLQTLMKLDEPLLPEFLCNCGLSYLEEEAINHTSGRDVIDGGSYNGDSVVLFSKFYNARTVYCFEPNYQSYSRMKQCVEGTANIICENMGLSDKNEIVGFGEHGMGSSRHKSGKTVNSFHTKCCRLDDYLSKIDVCDVGCIKLDVEGDCISVLKGAEKTIQQHRPLLLLSIYHTAEEFLEAKPFIESMELNYKFFVRKLSPDIFKETVLICVPQ